MLSSILISFISGVLGGLSVNFYFKKVDKSRNMEYDLKKSSDNQNAGRDINQAGRDINNR